MARLAISMALLLTGLTTHAAQAQSDEIDPEVVALADQAGVNPIDLAGAMSTTHDAGYDVTPTEYLCRTDGVLCPEPAPQTVSCGLPICGPLGQRIWCIESMESNHNGSAVNPSSGARGWLQWLPSTARHWGVTIGNRYSEWQAAAAIAAQGEPFFRSQWVPLQRGLC